MRLLPLAVLCILLAFTVIASWRVSSVLKSRNRSHFNDAVNQVEAGISDEFNTYIAVVRTGAGMFAAKPDISRDEFAAFVRRLRLSKFYPNVQGIGYAGKVLPANRLAFEQQVRAAGQTNFTIRPTGQADTMFPIVYLEPANDRNQAAIGFDMFSEPVRRAAMLKAITNGAAATGRVTLVQETGENRQPGFLFYASIFRDGASLNDPAQRAAAARGFVYAAFRAGDFFNGIFRNKPDTRLYWAIYDGTQIGPNQLLYQTDRPASSAPLLRTTRVLHLADHDWTIEYQTTPQFETTLGSNTSVLTPVTGVVVSFVLFAFTVYFVRQHEELLRRGAALSESEQRHRAISETASDAIIVIDEQSTIISVNASTERIFGHAREDMLGKDLTMLMPERMRERHRHGLGRYLAFGERHIPWTGVELPALHKDGNEFAVEISFAEIQSKSRRLFTGTVRDITERKKAEEQIQHLNRELERRVEERTAELKETNSQLEAFVYSVAHDLRAPVRSMRGFAEVLKEDYAANLDDNAKSYADRIMRSAEEMDRLILDLLAFSQIGREAIVIRPVSLAPLFDKIRVELEPEILRSHGTLHIESPLPSVVAHEPTLRQAFMNLLSNAIKFVEPDAKPDIHVFSEQVRDGYVRIWVEDKGIGIASVYHSRIFGVFERLNKGRYPGTGIGLAVVRRCVERMNGRVGVESELGKGSRFYIELPKA
ncbi:MAG: CHASE domain-containing sensor histidine kinase [Limisphaerales bacterium]